MKVRATTWAAVIYFTAVLMGAALWYIIGFTGTSSFTAARETFLYLLFQAPERSFFVLLAVLPIASLLLGIMYLSPLARSRNGLVGLTIAGAILAIAAWPSAHRITLILAFAYGCYVLWNSARRGTAAAPNNRLEPQRIVPTL